MLLKLRLWSLILLGALLVACVTQPVGKQPDLKRLYEISRISSAKHFQPPVVIIHGALGSKLRMRHSEQEIWPGSISKMIFGDYDSLRLKINPDTLEPDFSDSEAYALFEQAGGKDYYGRILRTLSAAGSYHPSQPGLANPQGESRVYVFVYDWRQDLTKSAARLDQFIQRIRLDYGMAELKVDIVAHSMGALVTRYFLRYGSTDVLDDPQPRGNFSGMKKVRKVVLIGAPNLGSVSGLQQFLIGFKVGTGHITTEALATMPSSYQLLPHPDRDWMVSPDGSRDPHSLYDMQTWRSFHWSIFDPAVRDDIRSRFKSDAEANRYLSVLDRYFEKRLRRARQFHRAISIPMENSPVRYIVFGGDCKLTPARCLIETVKGKVVIRLYPENIVNNVKGIDYEKLMLEPGDGRVTKPSLLARNALDPSMQGRDPDIFPLAYSLFLCEEHSQLTGNINFQDNLLNVLLLQETTEDRMQ